MIDYSLLGKRVSRLRKEKHWTQERLAERANLSNNYLSNIENNHFIPSLETLIKLCEALEITPDMLLLGVSNQNEHYLNDDILSLLNRCNPLEKRYIKGIIEVFLAEREG